MGFVRHLSNLRHINIPRSVHSDFAGYKQLLDIVDIYNQTSKGTTILLNFKPNTWFDANLLPVIYSIVEIGRKSGVTSTYFNQPNCKLHELLIRNGFAKHCFNLEYRPNDEETVIPFKEFHAKDTYNFASYIDKELVRYFPGMDKDVKKSISGYIQELFGNAGFHGNCNKIYTCGQYYFTNHKMDFTIVNLGKTFKENVYGYLQERSEPLPSNSIAWAVEPNHSTKRDITGGIGLSLMRDFINYNHGKFQIISGNEFWELCNRQETCKNFDHEFPGAIVNIEIDQNDKNLYTYSKNQISVHELLF